MSYNIGELITDELFSGGSLTNTITQGGVILKSIDLRTKNPESFTKQLKENIKLLSKQPGDSNIFGSFNYRVSLYPGDIDLNQEIRYKGNKEHVVKLFEKA